MSLLGLASRMFWPIRTAWSLWWASLWTAQHAPVPQARNLDEAQALIDDVRRYYKADPWDGRVDYTEDPRRVQWFHERNSLSMLPGFDCDDMAFYAVACLQTIAPEARSWVLIDPGTYSHCVCVFSLGGQVHVLDTNGYHQLAPGQSVLDLFGAIYPDARYEDAYAVDYPFPDPRKV